MPSCGPVLLSLLCTLPPTLALAQSNGAMRRETAASYAADVMRVARPDVPSLRRCYESTLGRDRRAWQRVDGVTLHIAVDGAVHDVLVAPARTRAAARFRSCLRPIATRWRLHPPTQHAPLEITFTAAELHLAAIQFQR